MDFNTKSQVPNILRNLRALVKEKPNQIEQTLRTRMLRGNDGFADLTRNIDGFSDLLQMSKS